MTNLTITVDEQTLKRARIRALEEDTSVSAVLREYLEEYTGVRREALQRMIKASRQSTSGSGPGGRTWKSARTPTRSIIRAF